MSTVRPHMRIVDVRRLGLSMCPGCADRQAIERNIKEEALKAAREDGRITW